MSRLIIDITTEQHQRIKALAATQGKSIKEYVLEKLFSSEAPEADQEAWEELKAVLQDRISSTERRGVSTKSVAQITEETLEAQSKS